MWIQLKTIYAGPKGNYSAGQVIDMNSKEAKDLIDGGYAIQCEAPKKVAEAEADEKAVADKEAAKKRGKQTR